MVYIIFFTVSDPCRLYQSSFFVLPGKTSKFGIFCVRCSFMKTFVPIKFVA